MSLSPTHLIPMHCALTNFTKAPRLPPTRRILDGTRFGAMCGPRERRTRASVKEQSCTRASTPIAVPRHRLFKKEKKKLATDLFSLASFFFFFFLSP